MFYLKNVKYKDILYIDKLELPKNKITCILGESGSGKTTLLKLLNKLISFDSGEILFNGKSINEIDSIELRRKVVMLPQTPIIFNGTVKDNLIIGLKFSEKPLVDDAHLYKILELVNLSKKLDDNPEKLSGGEKQRLALGRVILMSPDVFLLDEPSSSLDENTEEVVIKQMIDYAKNNNKTVIMVTHSRKIAKTFSDNIVEIKKSSIKIEDSQG